jgi:hypothetical protein
VKRTRAPLAIMSGTLNAEGAFRDDGDVGDGVDDNGDEGEVERELSRSLSIDDAIEWRRVIFVCCA